MQNTHMHLFKSGLGNKHVIVAKVKRMCSGSNNKFSNGIIY